LKRGTASKKTKEKLCGQQKVHVHCTLRKKRHIGPKMEENRTSEDLEVDKPLPAPGLKSNYFFKSASVVSLCA